MDKKLLKKNTLLFSVLGVAALVSAVLLVLVIWKVIVWSGYRDRTEKARSEIGKLVKQNPRPGKENERRLEVDIKTYDAAVAKFSNAFRPFQPAVDAFIETLQAPKADQLDEEEQEKYKVPGTGEAADPDSGKAAVPLKIRKLTQAEFCELFNARFEKAASEGMSDEYRMSMSALASFDGINNVFPDGNWQAAMNRFGEEIAKLTSEPMDEANRKAMLVYALGFIRRVDEGEAFNKHINAFTDEINKRAAAMKLNIHGDAMNFVGGNGSDDKTDAVAPEDRKLVVFHWDVFGDMVKRLGGAKVSTLQNVILRMGDEAVSSDSGAKTTINLSGSRTNVGQFKVSHYTLVFTGTMDAIRAAVRNFDQAYKDRRVYVVRSLCLYAKEDGAAVVMGLGNAVDEENRSDESEEVSSGSRYSRRRYNWAQKERDAARKKADAALEEQRQIAERDRQRPVHERSDYGMIRIGGSDECVAYLDVDYVVMDKSE